ncbi:septal ring lytic transglycosylase RlpA family protein [Sphingoaurantiacus capsulatus]|uniref:Endolytic peptidoglycan transglycosylase RlpA n=1 Tax=Sphingoaurantiacus capsulatus TaxID=1771310 RepID=A0ABV7XCU9_9SPHN
MRYAPLLALGLLAACAGSPDRGVGTASGAVKVGKPYQIAGKWYHPKDDAGYDERGIASWYGPGFHAKATATGETYDQDALTAAHKTLPMPSYVEVTNLDNGRRATLRINDRGPFVDKRIIDLSRRSAQLLGVDKVGLAKVRVKRVHLTEREIARLGLNPTGRGRGQQQAVQVAVATPPPVPVPVPQRITIPPRQIVVTPPPATVMVPPGQLYVQVAALSDRVRAADLATALESLATPNIEATPMGLFRVRLGPFADAASAAKVLDELQAAGYSDARVVGLPVS